MSIPAFAGIIFLEIFSINAKYGRNHNYLAPGAAGLRRSFVHDTFIQEAARLF